MVSRGAAPRDVPCLPQVWADGSTDQSVVVEVMVGGPRFAQDVHASGTLGTPDGV
jgi:hypothetical protein